MMGCIGSLSIVPTCTNYDLGIEGGDRELALDFCARAGTCEDDRMTRQLLCLFTLLGLALSIASAWADQLTGRVVGIADGDTLTVLTAQRQQHRVRLSGIGQVSKQHLSDLTYDKTVSVVFHKRDRYKRIPWARCS